MTKHNSTKMIVKPGVQEIVVIREFDAPRELVFRAYTDPVLYARWIGPRELSTVIEVFEPHLGGTYRFLQTDPDGHEFAFHGVYHEVTAPERIILTFEFEGLSERGHVSMESVSFDPMPDNRTKMITRSIFLSVADRDGMIAGGMERGEIESYERLDELLDEMRVTESLSERIK
jgi:uncharacterized protein YndB with AHSA1/START domain